MAIVFFSAGGSPWRQATVPVSEYTRVCSAEREFGSAKLFIPRGHAILDTDSIDEDGGTLIRIEHPLMPAWYGIQEGPMDQGPDGWSLEATEIGITLKYHAVPALTMRGPYTAGQIAERAFALLTDRQRGGIRPGSFVDGPPLLNDYAFTGTPLTSILSDLADRSGQEWAIGADADGHVTLNWIAPRGAMYQPLLAEGWDLVNVHRAPDTSTLVRSVIVHGRPTGFSGIANVVEVAAPELADNPLGQTVAVTSEQSSTLALELDGYRELDRRRYKNVRYRFGIRGHWSRTTTTADAPDMGESGGGFPLMGGGFPLMGNGFVLMGGGSTPGEISTTYATFSAPAWAIRTGDYLRAVCPSAGKAGTTILARVMKITYGDGYPEPVFECQEIMPVDQAQLAVRTYHGQRQLAHTSTVPRLLAAIAP